MSTIAKKSPRASAAGKTASKSRAKSGTTPARAAPTSAVTGKAPTPAKAATPSVVEAPQSVVLGPVMRKKELIDKVVEHSGKKKRDVKPVVESMLEVLGAALAEDRELNLPPFGKMKVRKARDLPNGRVMVTKVRQSKPKAPDTAE